MAPIPDRLLFPYSNCSPRDPTLPKKRARCCSALSRGLFGSRPCAAPHRRRLEFSLQELRLPDGRDPGSSVAWCPVSHLVGAPRRWVRLLGLTGRYWPRRATENPLLPKHILSRYRLDPDPISERARRAFARITARATGACVLSRSRRDAQGSLLGGEPACYRHSSLRSA